MFNSLCSNRRAIIQPSTCGASDSAIWGRAGAVVDPRTHRVYATSSNAPFDGRTNWGDTVLELSPAGKFLGHYTPREQEQLNSEDIDLGSTSPALLPERDAALPRPGRQGRAAAAARAAPRRRPSPKLGGERQIVDAPGKTDVFTALAVRGSELFAATNQGTGAFRLSGGKLHAVWSNSTPGTSPVLAGGVLWVYDLGGGLVAYRPGSGKVIHRFAVPAGHWNSPIVAGGRVYLPTGNANDHKTSRQPEHPLPLACAARDEGHLHVHGRGAGARHVLAAADRPGIRRARRASRSSCATSRSPGASSPSSPTA